MLPSLVLHGHPVSQPTRAVLIVLELLKVPYKLELAVPGSKKPPRGTGSAEYLNHVSQTGVVPVLRVRKPEAQGVRRSVVGAGNAGKIPGTVSSGTGKLCGEDIAS